MKTGALILAFFIVSIAFTVGQEVSFSQLTSEDGISQSEVYCFLHDSKGFMWFGTLDGLNKYEGYTIETFKMSKEDSNSLNHNTIHSIVEDKFGRIWIGTDDGLNVYDPQFEQMYSVPTFSSGKKRIIRSLLAEDTNLWIGTNSGLYRMPLTRKNITERGLRIQASKTNHVDIEINGILSLSSSVGCIIKSSDNKIWLGTWEGLCKFDYSTERSEHYFFYDLPGKLAEIGEVNSLIEDRNKNIWIGTQSTGLHFYDFDKEELICYCKKSSSPFPSDKIKSLTMDLAGNVWVGTLKDGLIRLPYESIGNENTEFTVYQNNEYLPRSINSNLIRSLYVSRDGLLWIGTIGNGINIYNPHQKRFGLKRIPPLDASGRVNNFLRAIYPDDAGNIWIGLHNDGLIKYDHDTKRYLKLGLEKYFTVFHIHPLNKDYLWIATSSGAHIIKKYKQTVTVVASVNFNKAVDVIAYNACFYIEESEPGIYWIASMSGIAKVVVKNDLQLDVSYINTDTEPALSLNNVRVLKYDKEANVLWAGTEGGGLNEIFLSGDQNPQRIRYYESKTEDTLAISNNYIRSLCIDGNQSLWAGTYEGLNRLNYDTAGIVSEIQKWKLEDGLANNMVQSVEVDAKGKLWIGSNGGLSKFDVEENRFTNYQISDGLQSNEFSEHCSYIDGRNTLYFGGIAGFNIFDPEQIRTDPIQPSVKITGFYLHNDQVKVNKKVNNRILLSKSIDQTDSLELRPRENDIRFDFSAMYFADPEKIDYMYRLDGYDQEWINTGASQRIANYTNLPSGSYNFQVRASNSDGTMFNETASIYIHIQTPYGLRWWAIVIYLLIFAASIFYFTRYSIIRIATKEKLLLENEHNQRIHELDMLRTRFFINISHDLRTPLTLIIGPLAQILKNIKRRSDLKNQLELINRNAKRLKYLVEQLLDIRKVETGKLKPRPVQLNLLELISNEAAHFEIAMQEKGLNFRIQSNDKRILLHADEAMLGKVFFNLFSNALKYTDKGEIIVRISKIPHNDVLSIWPDCENIDYIRVDVQDSGRGMEADKAGRIFERFYQDPENKGKGYGIGLSHCRDLVEAQKGYITVKSTKGHGSTFSVFFPYIIITEESTGTITAKTEHLGTEMPKVVADNAKNIEPERDDLLTLLIVDDYPDFRSYLRAGLIQDYNIIEAVNGEEGLAKARSFVPDMVISDVMMPEMDGVEFCSQIKSDIHTSHIPVILLTAKTDSETKNKGIETGADDYISKPFELEYLALRIKNIFKTREHLKNLFKKNIALEPSAVTVSSVDEIFLKKLMKVIEEGIPESDFSVDSMEQEMSMSHTNFYRKVKSLTDQSGKELLQNVRLKRAVQLLSQNDLRISEIAYMTGYTNPKYFSKCFKEKYGVSPSEYKEDQSIKNK